MELLCSGEASCCVNLDLGGREPCRRLKSRNKWPFSSGIERLRLRVEAGGSPPPPPPPPPPWWERIDETFADDPIYEQAMKLGLAYRESLRPGKPKARKRE